MNYDHIDDLVRRFREGDSEAAEQLIQMFQPIIQRAFRFLRYGYVGNDEIFAGLCKVYGSGKVSEGARIIADRLGTLEDDELIAEIHYCFLLAAHSSSNLQYGFRRNVARRVGHLLARKRRDVIYLEDIPSDHPSDDNEMEYINWVMGISASEPFDSLTEEERELLYLRIVLEKPFSYIAERFGADEQQLVKRYQQLIRRLKELHLNTSSGN